MIEVKNATKKFMNTKVLNDINLYIKEGEKVALMGPNGAGKTTLIRAILGFYHLEEGNIRVGGFDSIKNREIILKRVGFIPQIPTPIKLKVKELLEYVSKSSNKKEEIIVEFIEKMDLDIKNNLNKPFYKLSGGMKQKFLIGIAIAKQSDILIFDEPTANLDPKAREKFYKLLEGNKATTIFITHRFEEIKC